MFGDTGSDKGDDKKPNLSMFFNWGFDDEFISWTENALNRFSGFLNEGTYNSWSNALREFSSSAGQGAVYGTPSVSRYDACKSQGGRSVWSEDGFWRCLLKGESIPSNLKHEFKDYTGFLDYQRELLNRNRQELEAQRQKAEAQRQSARSTLQDGSKWTPTLFSSESSQPFPGSDRPRLISEEEAKGKNVVRQSQKTEAVTLEDGSLQSRTECIQYFEDGTALLKRTNDTDSKSSQPSSWFWK